MSRPLRILLATDKFKSCLTAGAVAQHLSTGLSATAPDAQIRCHPFSDGGDGFVSELSGHGFTIHTATVDGPLRRPVTARYATRERTAVIELASSSGLDLVDPDALEPRCADTFGLGAVIGAALRHAPERVVIGVGGSATSDGAAGALAALGAVLRGPLGVPLQRYGPDELLGVQTVDLAALQPGLAGTRLQVATDVTNPLLGEQGAAAVFGPQKGATPQDVVAIEAALTHWADVLERTTGRRGRDLTRAGAAGGAGFGLATALRAELLDGVDTFADLSGFASAVAWADVVITGEGSLDAQTTSGKAPVGVLRYARAAGTPCWAVVGRSRLRRAEIAALGFVDGIALADQAGDERSSMRDAARWLDVIGRSLGDHLRTRGPQCPLL